MVAPQAGGRPILAQACNQNTIEVQAASVAANLGREGHRIKVGQVFILWTSGAHHNLLKKGLAPLDEKLCKQSGEFKKEAAM